MWDGTIITRVRDRKMNEIITYAAMIKVDSTKKSQYVKLIDAISDDIDACEAILSSNGEARPVLGVIDCPEYLSRLSPAERSDEDEFNSYKVMPVAESDEDDMVSMIKEMISKAASELSNGSVDAAELESLRSKLAESENSVQELTSRNSDLQDTVEALGSLKDELRICRSRLEDLSKTLDDAQGRVGELEAENMKLRESSEGVDSLKEELSICRERIGTLSNELEYSRSQVAALEEGSDVPDVDLSWVQDKLDPIVQLLDQVADSKSESSDYYIGKLMEARDTIEALITEVEEQLSTAGLEGIMDYLRKIYSAQTGVWITLQLLQSPVSDPEEVSPVEEEPVEEAPAEEKEPVEEEKVDVEERPIYDRLLSDDELQVLTLVSIMKNAKVDFFVDMAFSGRFNENACEDVITFLKVDLSIIKDILSMDYTSKESIESNLRDILDILDSAPEPKHQKMYINSLTMDERVLEDSYNKIIAHLQDVMIERYTYLTE